MARMTAADLVNHIRENADALVRKVNPGCDYTGAWFALKVTETADIMARRLCQINTDAGRPDIARVIRLAWDQENR